MSSGVPLPSSQLIKFGSNSNLCLVMFQNLAHNFCPIKSCCPWLPWTLKFVHSSGICLFSSEISWCKILGVHIEGYSHNALGLTDFSEASGVNMRVFCFWNFWPWVSCPHVQSSSSPFFPLSVFALVSPPPSPFLFSPHPLPCSLASHLSLPLSPSPLFLCTLHPSSTPVSNFSVSTMQNSSPFLEILLHQPLRGWESLICSFSNMICFYY